jgi:tubulin gamma
MLDQFNRLITRKAFLEQYKKEKLFENGLEEFDDAKYVVILVPIFYSFVTLNRATCEELLREYKACESPEYITYVRCAGPSLMSVALILLTQNAETEQAP